MNYQNSGGSLLKDFGKNSRLLIVVLVAGFLLGILYVNMDVKKTGIAVDVWHKFYIERFESANVISEQLFWYVIRTRIGSIVAIFLLGSLKWKKTGMILWCGWTGFLFGILLVSSILQIGIKGIVVSIAGMVPHMLFYIPSYVIVLRYIYEYPRKQWNLQKTVFVVLSILVGSVLESYLNPIVMRLVAKIV